MKTITPHWVTLDYAVNSEPFRRIEIDPADYSVVRDAPRVAIGNRVTVSARMVWEVTENAATSWVSCQTPAFEAVAQ